MHRKKILLLLAKDLPSDHWAQWIKRHFLYQQHLLVKLRLAIPTARKNPEEQAPICLGTSSMLLNKRNKKTGLKLSRARNNSGSHVRTYDAVFQEVLAESQFADLLILEEKLFRAQYQYHGKVMDFGSLLAKISCPTLVLPESQGSIEQTILFYDGTYRTFSLIQHFVRDFFQLSTSLPITLLLSQPSLLSAPEEKLLIEYLKLNCHDLAVHKISPESQHTLPTAIDTSKCTLLVQSQRYHLPDFVSETLSTLEKATLTLK